MADTRLKIVATPLFMHDIETNLAIPVVNPKSEWVKYRHPIITIKLDGIQVEVINGKLYRMWPYPIVANSALTACTETFSEDVPLLEAFKNATGATALPDGIYEAFGPGIKGNHMNCAEPYMMGIAPLTGAGIIVNKGFTRIRAGHDISDKDMFDSIRMELADSPEIEGLVFSYEKDVKTPEMWAYVDRTDFGLPWPVQFGPA